MRASVTAAAVRCDIAVIGAGPAGLAAATRAAEAGKAVHVLDEGFGPGGQIWRPARVASNNSAAEDWLARFRRSGAMLHHGAAVFEMHRLGAAWMIVAECGGSRLEVTAPQVILAVGARERFLPFPGWTLPGVLGNGGAQALVKQGWNVEGKRVVVAGSGPLLLPVAATLAKAGARVAVVAEQAPMSALRRLAPALALRPGKLWEAAGYRRAFTRCGARYRTGWWVERAIGSNTVAEVVLTDGRRRESLSCDLLCVSYGLVPNLELPRSIGVASRAGYVAVDDGQRTDVAGIFVAGEPCGIAGVDAALAEGQIAGLAAAGRPVEGSLRRARRRGRSLGAAMEAAFSLRPELLRPPEPTTIVCRCEDVTAGEIDPAWSARQAKLSCRAGMGPCQGRVCGPALENLFGFAPDTVRSPLQPVAFSTLLTSDSEN